MPWLLGTGRAASPDFAGLHRSTASDPRTSTARSPSGVCSSETDRTVGGVIGFVLLRESAIGRDVWLSHKNRICLPRACVRPRSTPTRSGYPTELGRGLQRHGVGTTTGGQSSRVPGPPRGWSLLHLRCQRSRAPPEAGQPRAEARSRPATAERRDGAGLRERLLVSARSAAVGDSERWSERELGTSQETRRYAAWTSRSLMDPHVGQRWVVLLPCSEALALESPGARERVTGWRSREVAICRASHLPRPLAVASAAEPESGTVGRVVRGRVFQSAAFAHRVPEERFCSRDLALPAVWRSDASARALVTG